MRSSSPWTCSSRAVKPVWGWEAAAASAAAQPPVDSLAKRDSVLGSGGTRQELILPAQIYALPA